LNGKVNTPAFLPDSFVLKQSFMENLFQTVERIGPKLTERIDPDEQDGRLSKSVISTLEHAGFYKLFLPASLGGSEQDPLTVARLIEQIARYNTAAAWSVMVANASAWWSRCLPTEGLKEIYEHDENCFFAGAFSPPMKAERTEGGYLVSGQNPLCSNVHEAQWVAVSSIVMLDGQPLINNGMPEIRVVVMKKDDCRIVETWNALGMKATDSNDVAATNVFVPERRSYVVSPHTETNEHFKGRLYRFPVAGINGCCLIVPVALGIAGKALEELRQLIEKIPLGSTVSLKEKGSFQRKLGMAEALVRSARAYLHRSLSECWTELQSGEQASAEQKAGLLMTAAHVNRSCTEAVDMVYAASGTTGAYKRSAISRCFTDIQVVRQHGFANENRFETAAQLLLGLKPDFAPAAL
jgi:alkylation response protein AidB-like acyl-CoA dehydrogenase